MLWVESGKRGIKHGFELVVLSVLDGLELVLMTAGALNGQSQHAIERDLHSAFQHRRSIHRQLIGISVTFPGSILGVAKEVRGRQQLDGPRIHGVGEFQAAPIHHQPAVP